MNKNQLAMNGKSKEDLLSRELIEAGSTRQRGRSMQRGYDLARARSCPAHNDYVGTHNFSKASYDNAISLDRRAQMLQSRYATIQRQANSQTNHQQRSLPRIPPVERPRQNVQASYFGEEVSEDDYQGANRVGLLRFKPHDPTLFRQRAEGKLDTIIEILSDIKIQDDDFYRAMFPKGDSARVVLARPRSRSEGRQERRAYSAAVAVEPRKSFWGRAPAETQTTISIPSSSTDELETLDTLNKAIEELEFQKATDVQNNTKPPAAFAKRYEETETEVSTSEQDRYVESARAARRFEMNMKRASRRK